jgi:hypothetical protein
VWQAIDERLRRRTPQRRRVERWELALVAGGLIVTAVAMSWLTRHGTDTPWQVALQETGQSERTARKAAGDWIETSPATRAHIAVGTIGTVDVEPNARVRLGAVTGSRYRLSLDRGTISAQISAPPRMFIVDTPASAVVDLGCAYTVTVGFDGATELRMTSGWAALEWNGTETLVPAGAISRTRKGHRPGLPYFEDAPPALQQAINGIDAEGITEERLTRMLMDARVRDTLTLWHLLSRTDATQRVRVYDRLQQLVAAPAGVTRDRVLQLDPDALRRWREELAWHW